MASWGEFEAAEPELSAKVAALFGRRKHHLMATVRRDGMRLKNQDWSAAEEEAFKAPVREKYEREGHPFYATARLWDDGVIDPADTRRVLGLGLAASLHAPIPQTRFGEIGRAHV